jgi:hypothetical protein
MAGAMAYGPSQRQPNLHVRELPIDEPSDPSPSAQGL